jgi:ABC-type antimicrobial peptide transport system permease subunit
VAAGLLFAFWTGRYTEALLYGLTPAEPSVYALAVAILGGTAAVATAVPAFRASRTDPMQVLRCE